MASLGKWLLMLGMAVAGMSTAWAAAVTYGFSVSSYTCLEEGCPDQAYFVPKLASMTMTLDDSQPLASASLQMADMAGSGSASGVLALDFTAWGVQADPAQGTCSETAAFFCDIQLALSIGTALGGDFLLGTSNDTVLMSVAEDGWWSGRIYSDGPFMTGDAEAPLFRGQWLAINQVPEPDSGLLLLTLALAGFTARASRRARR